jgi:hypothetical protein
MSTRPEVIAAAEALRLWVQRQRATWPDRPSMPPIQAAAAAALIVRQPPRPAFLTTLTSAEDENGLLESQPSRTVSLLRRGVTVAGTVAASLAILALLGLAGRTAWTKYITGARGTAVIDSSPDGAEVLIDGNSVGVTPLRLPVPTGRHIVELRRRGATRAQALQISRNRDSLVTIDWNLRPKGRLKIESDPKGAHVFVDGRDVGKAPMSIPDLVIGVHTIVLETPEGSVRRQVEITEGVTEEVSESIFPGWVRVSAPVEVTVSENGRAVPLDDHNRAMLKPGVHQLRIDNTSLHFSEVHKVEVEPGATASVDIDTPLSTLTVTTGVPAEVSVDGVRVGDAPIVNLPVKLGTRSISATDRLGTTRRVTVTVTAHPSTVEIPFQKP